MWQASPHPQRVWVKALALNPAEGRIHPPNFWDWVRLFGADKSAFPMVSVPRPLPADLTRSDDHVEEVLFG